MAGSFDKLTEEEKETYRMVYQRLSDDPLLILAFWATETAFGEQKMRCPICDGLSDDWSIQEVTADADGAPTIPGFACERCQFFLPFPPDLSAKEFWSWKDISVLCSEGPVEWEMP